MTSRVKGTRILWRQFYRHIAKTNRQWEGQIVQNYVTSFSDNPLTKSEKCHEVYFETRALYLVRDLVQLRMSDSSSLAALFPVVEAFSGTVFSFVLLSELPPPTFRQICIDRVGIFDIFGDLSLSRHIDLPSCKRISGFCCSKDSFYHNHVYDDSHSHIFMVDI